MPYKIHHKTVSVNVSKHTHSRKPRQSETPSFLAAYSNYPYYRYIQKELISTDHLYMEHDITFKHDCVECTLLRTHPTSKQDGTLHWPCLDDLQLVDSPTLLIHMLDV